MQTKAHLISISFIILLAIYCRFINSLHTNAPILISTTSIQLAPNKGFAIQPEGQKIGLIEDQFRQTGPPTEKTTFVILL